MLVEILKKDFLKRLQTQDLVQMRFFDCRVGVLVKGCSTCAVGCLISMGISDSELVTKAHGEFKLDSMLSALSDVFEREEDLESARRVAIAHVRKHFPAKIQVDIGNCKPRRGVKRVNP